MSRAKIVVFTGAGMSADSGLKTFRDHDGLWANYRIEEICTSEALRINREKVIDFYNTRRREVLQAKPNVGHFAIAQLERYFDVDVVTQNVDDLHERAGSSRVLHLHGEIRKLRSSIQEDATIVLEGAEQPLDLKHSDGSLLRPFIVLFGEPVPMFDKATAIVSKADILLIVGTSLAVYPAALLVKCIKPTISIYLVDPTDIDTTHIANKIYQIKMTAAKGLPTLIEQWIHIQQNNTNFLDHFEK